MTHRDPLALVAEINATLDRMEGRISGPVPPILPQYTFQWTPDGLQVTLEPAGEEVRTEDVPENE